MAPPPPPRKKTSLLVWIAVGVAILLFLGLFAARLLTPNLSRAKLHAQEMSAMRVVTTLHTAEAQYYSLHGKFAATLSELGSDGGGLIPPGLAATGDSAGYHFTLAATGSGYTINASPTDFGTTGSRTFFSDQSMTIHQHSGREPAGPADPEF